MKYTEIMELVKANHIDIVSIDVASACADIFDFDYTDDEYNALCGKVEEVFMSQFDMGCDIDSIAHAINDFIVEEEMPISKVLELDRHDVVEQASYWN